MGLIDGELCFVRVLPWFVDGHSDQVTELARVKAKELLLTVTDPRDALVAHKTAVEDPARDAIKTLVKTEQKDNEYNNPFSYQKYKAFNLKTAAATKLEEKKAKEVKAMAQAAERLASNKNGRKCGDRAIKVYKQILQG
ncbi:hypothetical protein EKO04_009909 [Ascochyta lentis]|uniref:Uncharacterized protein n=1 Tax=Ascochyta lentis TaxID=205686 RepID=A0A8H7MBR7_9PLEO|nr:hypothetical protein EKO04_009909 [Ascochyta lentis]